MVKKQQRVSFLFFVAIILLGLASSFLNISNTSSPYVEPLPPIAADNQKSISFWENFLVENPTYILGWVALSEELSIANQSDYAVGALNTARAINPNHTALDK